MSEQRTLLFCVPENHIRKVLRGCENSEKPFIISGGGREELKAKLRRHRPTAVVADFDGTICRGNSFTRLWSDLPIELRKIYQKILELYESNQMSGIEKAVLESGMVGLLAASFGACKRSRWSIEDAAGDAVLRAGAKDFFDLFHPKNRCIVSLSIADYIREVMRTNGIKIGHILGNELLYREDPQCPIEDQRAAVAFAVHPEIQITSETKWSAVCQRMPKEFMKRKKLCIGDSPPVDHGLWMQEPRTFNVLIRPASQPIAVEQVPDIWHKLDLIVSDLPTLTNFLRENGVG